MNPKIKLFLKKMQKPVIVRSQALQETAGKLCTRMEVDRKKREKSGYEKPPTKFD